jgi:hypothetical protein
LATKKKTPTTGSDAPTGHRLNRAKILDDIRKNKSYRGGSGSDRKALFDVKLPCKVWVLPDIRPRGPENDPLPYLSLTVHWLDRTTKDGRKYRSGITCFDALVDDEPGAYQRFLKDGLIKDERCAICELMDAYDEKEFPQDTYGKPKIAPVARWHFQVLKEEQFSRGDDHPIKVLSAGATGRDNFMALVGDEDVAGASKFETEGMYTSWEKTDKAWRVTPLTPKKIWLPDWQKKLLDLEIITPVFLEREQIIQDLIENLPQFSVSKFFNLNGAPVKKVKEPAPGKAMPPRNKKKLVTP